MPEPERKSETDPAATPPDDSRSGEPVESAKRLEQSSAEGVASDEGVPARNDGESAPGKEDTAGLVRRTRQTLAREAEVEREVNDAPLGKQIRTFSGKAGRAGAGLGKRGASHAQGWLVRSFSDLGQALSPASIGDAARASMLFWHWMLFDREFDKLLFRPTAKQAKINTLTVRGNRAEGRDYRPTPALVFEWVMSAIRDDLSHYRFVDYGAGRGRVLLMASQHPFKSIGGVEFAEELFEDARLNIAQFPRPRMQCRQVACELADVTTIVPPGGTTVHYFFAPFSRKVFAEVMNGIAASLRERPRPAYVVLLDSRDGDLVRGTGLFTRVNMKLGARLESFLFSPYRIEVYRAKDG
ncbi:hypothetical protein A7A08_00745 [Methyloligella halotolerans]|uniref:DOT1 domain-containing protein n=1 Tax=Methyloligella halotolerans TaxID=1177755 RepID=A0A1E2S395_9HYPH|nr:hypothetical protein [Methyloligella halotolerans]ODA68911.1 hypothetical protein A7A08_00745 [Methyloligella halotolerans]